MRLLHTPAAVTATFDDHALVSRAGLEPVMRLAEGADLHGLVAERVHIPTDKGSNAAGKVATIVAGMVAGADCIDDMNIVRDAGSRALFGGGICAVDVGVVPARLHPWTCVAAARRGPGLPGRAGRWYQPSAAGRR